MHDESSAPLPRRPSVLAKRPHPSSAATVATKIASAPTAVKAVGNANGHASKRGAVEVDGGAVKHPGAGGAATVLPTTDMQEHAANGGVAAGQSTESANGAGKGLGTSANAGAGPGMSAESVGSPSAKTGAGAAGKGATTEGAAKHGGAGERRSPASAGEANPAEGEKSTGAATGNGAETDSATGASSKSVAPVKKARKPYTISRQRENWTANEHQLFLDALKKYGRSWKQIEAHVRTKNVIQIRSHAQKYFLKLQKNNIGEHVPPPRPKRRNALNGVAGASVTGGGGTPPGATGTGGAATGSVLAGPFGPAPGALQGNPHAAAAAYVAAQQFAQSQHQQQAHGGAALRNLQIPPGTLQQPGALPQPGQSPGHLAVPSQQQQQQFAAAVQQHLQLLQFGSIPPASNPFISQHALHPMHAALHPPGQLPRPGSAAPTLPRQSMAKSISPRVSADAASRPATVADTSTAAAGSSSAATSGAGCAVGGQLSLPFPLVTGANGTVGPPTFPAHFPGGVASGQPLAQSMQPAAAQQMINQQRHLMQLNPILGGSAGSMVSDGSLAGSGSGTATASGSATAPVSPLRSSSLPGNVGNGLGSNASPAAAATAAAATANGAPAGSASSPNFTRIYAFFAELFNPLVPKIVEEVVSTVESSTLDCEIIKLLVRNLEVNLTNNVFREQLTQTYRDQQITQQQQHEQHVVEQAEQQLQAENSLAWISGAGAEGSS